jgi:hypothetical protein
MLRRLLNKLSRFLKSKRDTGNACLVENTSRYRAANPEYVAVRVRYDGEAVCLLFTENEWQQAAARAQRNPEDVPWCNPATCECGEQS